MQRAYRQLHGRSPRHDELLLALGERCAGTQRWERAIECFQQVSEFDPELRASAILQLGEIQIRQNDAVAAESSFKTFLSLAAQLPETNSEQISTARHWLTFLDSAQLRYEERQGTLEELLQDDQANVYDIKQRYFPNLLIWNSTLGRERNRDFLAMTPNDPWINLAEVRYRLGEGRMEEADALLSQLQDSPALGQHWLAVRLELDYELDDWRAMQQHLQQFDRPGTNEPWLLLQMRGEAALHREDWPEAIHHFEALLAAEPAHLSGHMGLARALREQGNSTRADEAASQAKWLAKIRPELSSLTEVNLQAALDLADECEAHELIDTANSLRAYVTQQERRGQREGVRQ